jgi:hypothetical protein
MGGILKNLFGKAFLAENATAPGEVFPAPGSPEAVLLGVKGMLTPVTAAYRLQYRRNGATPKGVFWSSEDNMRKRFEILSRVFYPEDIATGEACIADLGCGYGALYDFLKAHPILRGGEYRGYDICKSLLDACKTRVRDPRASFHLSMRVTEPADYLFVSGTFNLKLGADEVDWLTYIQTSLEALWNQTNKALAFNMLDITDAGTMSALYYADPQIFETFCRDNLSDNVTLISGYGLPDFTIFVHR